jgi:peptide/nickel transport system ATP-binding protein
MVAISGLPADATLPSSQPSSNVLEVRSLGVKFRTEDGIVNALDRVTFDLHSQETLGILGESGSGKSTLALALMTVLPDNAMVEGEARFSGEVIADPQISGGAIRRLRRRERRGLSEKLSRIRWRGISMVFQGSQNAFNPVYTIDKQITEVFQLHTDLTKQEIHPRVVRAVQRAGLDPAVLKAYPHELSGGMKQRAVIAMALALNPKLIIADEPTTGLDVVTQARLISELKELRRTRIQAMIVISHDIGVIAQLADRVAVMYAGRIMELAPVATIYTHSANPYSMALVESYPSIARARTAIQGIPGAPPDPIHPPPGCQFAPRCAFAEDICRREEPPLIEIGPGHWSACHFATDVQAGRKAQTIGEPEPLLPIATPTGLFERPPLAEAVNLTKFFDLRASAGGALFTRPGARRVVHAVERVNLDVRPSEIVGVVGESGSGKTTLGRTLLRVVDATGGELKFRFRGEEADKGGVVVDVETLGHRSKQYREFRRRTQMIFQDPYDSLDPNQTIFDIVEEPLIAHHLAADPRATLARIEAVLETVRLSPPRNYLDRYPHELSGGERQRVAAARALVLRPDLLVADEPISMLDVSLRAGFLNLLRRMRVELGTTIVYVTHDIASARYVSDRILVMYVGMGIEFGPSEEVIREPLHPYTKALIQAVPLPTPAWNPGHLEIQGEIGNAIDVPKGCRFAGRCPYRQPQCDTEIPPRKDRGAHWYLCHFTQEELAQIRSRPGFMEASSPVVPPGSADSPAAG